MNCLANIKPKISSCLSSLILLTGIITSPSAPAAEIAINPVHSDGCLKVNESVEWSISGGNSNDTLSYTVKTNGLTEIASGKLSFTDGTAKVSAKVDQPATLLLTVKDKQGKKIHGGAAIDWPAIQPSAPEPTDFDDFWKSKIKELSSVPMDIILEELDSGTPGIQLWKISMGNINGSKIRGYLARPTGTTPLPAMLQLQHAGTRSLDKNWVLGPAKNGWLALNIISHDIPVDRDASFYQEQFNGPLKDYMHQGGDDREKSYFLRMFLGCYRAVDYLTGRDDWNKSSLLVQGVSLGGMQGLAVAGLHPSVTCLTVDVPAGSDQHGAKSGRTVGFPWWITNASSFKVAGYYDTVNFAKRIHCPVLVGVGLCDTICPPSGTFTMFNQIKSPKRMVIMPSVGHTGNHSTYDTIRSAWWKATAKGEALPLK